MKPGRELDALVAEKVMGWTWDHYSAWSPTGSKYARVHPFENDPWSWLPSYSTDIAAAWEVVEKLTSVERPHFELVTVDAYSPSPKWHAEFDLDRPLKRI